MYNIFSCCNVAKYLGKQQDTKCAQLAVLQSTSKLKLNISLAACGVTEHQATVS